MARALEPRSRAAIVRELKAIGYRYVTLDLQGYRTGSLNEGLLAASQRDQRNVLRLPASSRRSSSSRFIFRTCPPRSKISTPSTSRSASAHFDVAQHQPHPPGYPLFILLARARTRSFRRR